MKTLMMSGQPSGGKEQSEFKGIAIWKGLSSCNLFFLHFILYCGRICLCSSSFWFWLSASLCFLSNDAMTISQSQCSSAMFGIRRTAFLLENMPVFAPFIPQHGKLEAQWRALLAGVPREKWERSLLINCFANCERLVCFLAIMFLSSSFLRILFMCHLFPFSFIFVPALISFACF